MNSQKTNKYVDTFLDIIERTGNKMPHPATLFFLFSVAIVFISEISTQLGLSITFERLIKGEVTTQSLATKSLLSKEGISFIFSSMTPSFTGFAPLGVVLVAMLGVGVAEGTGLISAVLRKLVLSTPKVLVSAVVVFAGIMSNLASDAGYVVLVPLGAVIFISFGRHPLAGLAAAFSGVSGGFSANLLVSALDPLLGGLSTEAAHILDPNYNVLATDNWYFLIVSTFLITTLGALITDKIVEPRLGKYHGEAEEIDKISKLEGRGMIFALISTILLTIVLAFLILPESAPLRDPKTGSLSFGSGFMSGLVPIITLYFLVPGMAYGIGAKTLKSDKDLAAMLEDSMSAMGGYIVLAFFAAQFISYFNYTNLGTVIAVKGANILEAANFTGMALIISFIFITGLINLFIGSSSAKWAIMAPVFIPMLMRLGFAPEFTQVIYRIGDSVTNIISPLMPYFAIIVAFAKKYDKDSGIGTLVSIMIPYSIIFFIGWTIMLSIWFLFKLPLGPGDASILLN
jgi:aminobenzoyl-glutamate transport protein